MLKIDLSGVMKRKDGCSPFVRGPIVINYQATGHVTEYQSVAMISHRLRHGRRHHDRHDRRHRRET